MHVFAIFTCFNLKLAGDNHEKHTKVTQEFIQFLVMVISLSYLDVLLTVLR